MRPNEFEIQTLERQEILKELLLLYHQKTGKKSPTLAREIFASVPTHGQVVTRHDIDKWISGRTKVLDSKKLAAVDAFIASPRVVAIIGAESRMLSPGDQVIFDGRTFARYYGYDQDSQSCERVRSYDGLWHTFSGEYGHNQMAYTPVHIRFSIVKNEPFGLANLLFNDSQGKKGAMFRASGFLFHDRDRMEMRVRERSRRIDCTFSVFQPKSDPHYTGSAYQWPHCIRIVSDANTYKIFSDTFDSNEILANRCNKACRCKEEKIGEQFDEFLWSVLTNGSVE